MSEHEHEETDGGAIAPDAPEVEFGEQDEKAQEAEWEQDAEEGGAPES